MAPIHQTLSKYPTQHPSVQAAAATPTYTGHGQTAVRIVRQQIIQAYTYMYVALKMQTKRPENAYNMPVYTAGNMPVYTAGI